MFEMKSKTSSARVALMPVVLLLVLATGGAAASSSLTLRGGEPRYGIDFWREAEGLPQSRIRAITQTRDGYLWLGTDNGIVRFNGASFTAFNVKTGSLRDNEVWAIQEDDEGGLWIGTYGGGLTLFKDGHFTTFTTAEGLPDDVIMGLDKDPAGNIWIATPGGAGRYSKGVFTQFTTKDGLSNNYVTAISAHSPGGVFIATGASLYRFTDGRLSLMNGIVEESDGVIEHMIMGGDGALWLSLSNATIKKWDDGALTTYTRQQNLTPHISLIYEDRQGVLWTAMENGLNRLKDGKFEPVPLESDVPGLGAVYSMYADREGNIWLGLQSNGLGRLRIRQLVTLTAADGLHNDSTRSVYQDSQGTIWVGTASGFASYKDGRFSNYEEVDGARLGAVRSFAEDASGNIWIAAGEKLLILKHGQLTNFPNWKNGSEIEALYKDALGRMWVGTDGDGLFQFEDGKFRNYRTQDGLASNHVRAIFYDTRGALWVSVFGRGVSKFSDGKFSTYTTSEGLAGNRVLTIYEDDEGTLWFSTRDGLSRLRDGKFFNYTSDSGLLVGFVYTILDDGIGNFWFSCAQGLFRVSKAELKDVAEGRLKNINSVDYGVRDGMKTRAFNLGNQPAAWKTADGSLLFSSLKGVVIVEPGRISSNNFIPPVYIEQVLINKQEQSLYGESRNELGAGEVEIHFAALSYLAPEKLRYKYKLEGFDKDWVDAGVRRFAYYANLPPRQYRFRVTAGNVDGAWNETGAASDFYLKPRFYQTRWFLALVGLGVLLIAGLLYRLRMMGLKARYSAVLAERNRIAREIHDTLAQNLAGIALQLDSVTMRLADVPAELRELLDQACNLTRYSLAEARRSVADLRSDELEREELASALPIIANKMTANASLQARVTVVGAPRRLNPMTEKNLLRIFQEALANSVKHAQAQTVNVDLKYEIDGLTLCVRDDGRGFDTGKIIPLGVGHYGLTGMRERAERIGGHLTLTSKPGEGTELIVEVPFSS